MRVSHGARLQIRKMFAVGLAVLTASFASTAMFATQAQADEIAVNIRRLRALDKIDALSKADFYARVTIAGEVFTTEAIKDQDDIRPNWLVRKRVSSGIHNVKVEILDKDVAVTDLVDINRVEGKRDLDFQVDTQRCAVLGFSETYRCRSVIQREGTERKKAQITFSISVDR